jgi:DNA invertase Pin-like site-specific DNA recombinase
MLTNHIKELEAAKAKVVELESAIITERHQALITLPAQLGYSDVVELIAALREAHRASKTPRIAKKSAVKEGAGSRAKITDEVRAEVKKLIEAGKSGAEIATAVGISLPSVQNIKKQLGLVKARIKA